MQRMWYGSIRRGAIAAGTGVLLIAAGQLSAQTSPPTGSQGIFGTAGQSQDESAARFVAGPKGEILRIWKREGDVKAGGGAVLVAVARPNDAWETLLELRSTEKGVTIRDGELSVGSGNELAVAYRWWRNDPRSKQIRVARSDDAGKTWVQPTTSVDASGTAFDPKIALGRGKNLVVVWADERRGGRLFDIYARRSTDGGVTWEPEQQLSRFSKNLPNDLYARPTLLSDGQDRLWAFWVGVRASRSSLYLNRSTDGGRTWTEPVALTGESVSVYGEKCVRAGDQLLLVWHDTRTEHDRLYAVSSRDAGVTWTPPVRVDHLPAESQVDTTAPTVLLNADGEALVAWHDARNRRDDIFLTRSTDWGRSWGQDDQRMDMDEPGTGVSRFVKLARSQDGRIALAWEDDRDGLQSVYVRIRSSGSKPEWGPEIVAAPQNGKLAARLPDLIWGADKLYVGWEIWNYTLGLARITKQISSRALSLSK